MKILYHHRVAAQDGQAVHITELVHAFRSLGHEVKIIGPSLRPKAFGQENKALAIFRRVMPGFVSETLEYLYAIRAYRKLLKAYKEFQPDFLYERHNLFLPSGGWLRKKTGVLHMLEVNAPLAAERTKYAGLHLKSFATKLEKHTWREADHALPVSEVLAAILEKAGTKRERITVLHNGIDKTAYENNNGQTVRERYGLGDNVVLGFTGFVREWHKLDEMIRLIADYRGNKAPHLLIVGDGPAIQGCRAAARGLKVEDRVHFAGFVDRADIPEHLAAMNIALQPAVTAYASPLKLFEYMAAGLSIVAPSQANICEILDHERDALLFPPDDYEAAQAHIRQLIADPAKRQSLGRAAQAKIDTRGYTWLSNAQRVCNLAKQSQTA
ncbi:glycosyltransferase family 4 protein [Kordiimonas aestuarii]|uniref:glycosyltransferase family 4 protein n=1 Tax=Kordiimonas aestuarii TaxID=1005925 RepID=UPI0021D35FB7|nr:glycosyltransferase family 4 protein [Kordiimonas aestuarii]